MSFKPILLLLITLPFFTCDDTLEHAFSMEYYYSLRVNDKQDMTFLLDTSTSDTKFFTEPSKTFSSFLPVNDSDLVANVEINGLYIRDFEFDLSEDKTGISHNDQCQGIIGFGIDDDGENSIIDALAEQKIIKRKVLYFTTVPSPKIQFQIDIPKKNNLSFTECSLSKSDELDDDYEEMWKCDMSHIYFPVENKSDLTLNDTIEVDTIAGFDAKSYYITASLNYIEQFKTFFNEHENVSCVENEMDEFVYLSCSMTNETLKTIKAPSFMFDGMLYEIDTERLFMQMEEDKYTSLIRFRNITEEDEDIWIFGYPLFASYMMEFDFDRKVVGFNGKVAPLNLTVEWEEWDKETKKFSFTKILENRNVMIIGIVCISIVLLIIIALVIKCIVSRRKGNEQHGPLVEN